MLALCLVTGPVVSQTCNLTTTGACGTQCSVTITLTDHGVDRDGPCGNSNLIEVTMSATCGSATCGPQTWWRCSDGNRPVGFQCNGSNVSTAPQGQWGGAVSGNCNATLKKATCD